MSQCSRDKGGVSKDVKEVLSAINRNDSRDRTGPQMADTPRKRKILRILIVVGTILFLANWMWKASVRQSREGSKPGTGHPRERVATPSPLADPPISRPGA